jgi:hypothetical protein
MFVLFKIYFVPGKGAGPVYNNFEEGKGGAWLLAHK